VDIVQCYIYCAIEENSQRIVYKNGKLLAIFHKFSCKFHLWPWHFDLHMTLRFLLFWKVMSTVKSYKLKSNKCNSLINIDKVVKKGAICYPKKILILHLTLTFWPLHDLYWRFDILKIYLLSLETCMVNMKEIGQ